MKTLLTTVFLGCACISFAQGIQGNVKLAGGAIVRVTGHTVALTWNASQGATSYNVYRSTTHGGPYTKVASVVTNTAYVDAKVKCSQTLYYVATAVSGSSESGYSNEAVVSVP